jgi:hypothetical protein
VRDGRLGGDEHPEDVYRNEASFEENMTINVEAKHKRIV